MKKSIIIIFISLNILNARGSRFGLIENSLGNIVTPYSAAGIGRSYEIAHYDSTGINFMNYANWHAISKTTLSANINYNAIWSENSLENDFTDDASFDGAFLGIPLIPKKMVLGMGITPYTALSQRILSDVDSVNTNALTRGGVSRATINLAYQIHDQLSIGLGYEYIFGKISEKAILTIQDEFNSTISYETDRRIRGHGLVISAFYKPNPKLNVGLVLRPTVFGTLTRAANTASDAINEPIEDDLNLPAQINLGLEYEFADQYFTGIDVLYQDWKNGFELNSHTINKYDTFYHLGWGFERRGSNRRFVNYLEKIDIRTGVFYKNLAHVYNNNAVNEIGFSLGFSFPIVMTRSKLDIAGFISKRGDLDTHTLQETVVGFKFSISANEVWFVNLED